MVDRIALAKKLVTLRNVAISCAMFTPMAALSETDIPRTAEGRPDLSGTYNVATLTPLRRPARLADRLTLTDGQMAHVVLLGQRNAVNDAVFRRDGDQISRHYL